MYQTEQETRAKAKTKKLKNLSTISQVSKLKNPTKATTLRFKTTTQPKPPLKYADMNMSEYDYDPMSVYPHQKRS